MLGLAVGDALGAQVEFKSREQVPRSPVTGMPGGGPYRLSPGQWTDDTSQAFAMGRSIVELGDFNPLDIMRRFVAWRDGDPAYCATGRGCFDIGGTTSSAISRFL